MEIPPSLHQRVNAAGQGRLLRFWDELDEHDQRALQRDLEGIDFDRLQRLLNARAECRAGDGTAKNRADSAQAPTQLIRQPKSEADQEAWHAAAAIGRDLIAQGKVGVLLVAGGQGTRLGFDKPKGMFPVGPVSGASLFQVHAEKVLALRRRHGKPVPFLVMTSPINHAETEAFFQEHHSFGLPPEDVSFFTQGTMPALDLRTGKLLMEEKGRLFTSPNGHGGSLTALAESGETVTFGFGGSPNGANLALIDAAYLESQAAFTGSIVG